VGLDRVDQAVEGAVQRRHPHRAHRLPLPDQRHVGRFLLVGGHERRTHRVDDRLDRPDERVDLAHRVTAPGPRTCWMSMLTWSAPLAIAARTTAATTSAVAVAGTTHPDPNGPTSTSWPSVRAASIAAVTCGPGRPST